VWAGSHIKNAPQMKRKIVRNKEQYLDFVSKQNNKTNVYTTVYDFELFAETAKVESSVILDRIFLDFDAHESELDLAWRDVKEVMNLIKEEDWKHNLFFSGRGFHLFLYGEKVNDIRNIQYFFRTIKEYLISKVGEKTTLDDRVGQATRLRRVPNTVNMSSNHNGNPLFCIPLEEKDLSLSLYEVLDLASKQRILEQKISGKNEVVFPVLPPIETVEGEVKVPQYSGNLPILPCLHNAIMTENPSHLARAYLVSWFRDLLTQRRPLNSLEDKRKVLDLVVAEIKNIVESNEEVWLDWDEETTRKHARFTVFNNYKTPFCKTKLIPEGYCVGKCWRYPDYLDKEEAKC